jgi:hypothetical protein
MIAGEAKIATVIRLLRRGTQTDRRNDVPSFAVREIHPAMQRTASRCTMTSSQRLEVRPRKDKLALI